MAWSWLSQAMLLLFIVGSTRGGTVLLGLVVSFKLRFPTLKDLLKLFQILTGPVIFSSCTNRVMVRLLAIESLRSSFIVIQMVLFLTWKDRVCSSSNKNYLYLVSAVLAIAAPHEHLSKNSMTHFLLYSNHYCQCSEQFHGGLVLSTVSQ